MNANALWNVTLTDGQDWTVTVPLLVIEIIAVS